MVYVQKFFPTGLAGRGQALYSGVSFGLGGALGAILSGFMWDRLENHGLLFIFSAVFSCCALMLVRRLK
jgi:PPP family 3-phenylpropionic acid transporter